MTRSAPRKTQAAQPSPVAEASGGRSFPRKVVAIVLAAAWIGVLAVLALTQANPITLNREQILRAELVVTARIENVAEGTAAVEQQWGGGETLGSITVINLRETAAENGGTYILPLVRGMSGSYEILAAHVPDHPYLVYPATQGALEQLQQLLL
jgi:hypothetical protein